MVVSYCEEGKTSGNIRERERKSQENKEKLFTNLLTKPHIY